MTLSEILKNTPDHVLLDATDSMVRSCMEHYKHMKPENIRARMANIYYALRECVEKNSDAPIVKLIRKVGEERFEAGYYLHEVQSAINILEESLWKQIVEHVKPDEQSPALERISRLSCLAKNELAKTYIAHEKAST